MARTKRISQELIEEEFLRELRSRQGYYGLTTQKTLAEVTGITPQTLSRKLRDPDSFTVKELRSLVETLRPDERQLLRFVGVKL